MRRVISTNQFKNGSHIEIDGSIYKILEFQHVKPGKGGAFVRTKLRRIDDGSVQDKTFRAGEKFRPVHTESRKMQYLYDSGEAAVFMDSQDYEQIEIPGDAIGEAMRWVLPNDEVDVLFVDERPSDVQVASAIEMKVTGDPGVGRRRPGAAVHRRGRDDPGRHADRRVHLAGLTPVSGRRPSEARE
jgi:elongation factor P